MTVQKADKEGVKWAHYGYCQPCSKLLDDVIEYTGHVATADHQRKAKRWQEMRAEK